MFRLRIKEPPAAPSRRKFKTVEARCGACRLGGGGDDEGVEEPCMKPSALRAYEKSTGYPCPLRMLDPSNLDAWDVIRGLLNADLVPTVPFMLATACDGLSIDERRALVDRVATAMGDPRVVSILHPDPKGPASTTRQRDER